MAENILTRKYAGVPGWAIGGGAVLIGLGFFYFRSKGSSASQTGASQPAGSLVNNPAASSIPYVPSVTVTGIPPTSSAASNTTSSGVTGNTVVAGSGSPSLSSFGGQIPLYVQRPSAGGSFTQSGTIPFGTTMHVTGAPVQGTWYGQAATWLPVDLFGTSNTYFVSATDVTQGSGGSGGWGQAGTTNPVVFMGTTAWNWGGSDYPQAGAILSQRAGVKTAGSGGRFDYGGAGSGPGGSSNTRKSGATKDFKALKRRRSARS